MAYLSKKQSPTIHLGQQGFISHRSWCSPVFFGFLSHAEAIADLQIRVNIAFRHILTRSPTPIPVHAYGHFTPFRKEAHQETFQNDDFTARAPKIPHPQYPST